MVGGGSIWSDRGQRSRSEFVVEQVDRIGEMWQALPSPRDLHTVADVMPTTRSHAPGPSPFLSTNHKLVGFSGSETTGVRR